MMEGTELYGAQSFHYTGTYQNERFPSLLRLLKMPFVGIDSEALNRIGRHAAGLYEDTSSLASPAITLAILINSVCVTQLYSSQLLLRWMRK